MTIKIRYGSMIIFTVLAFILSGIVAEPAFANKSSISIDVPSSAEKGTTIVVKLSVSHKGNNFIHHTNWVVVKVDGAEIKRWEYKWNNLPEAGNFTVETPLVVEKPVQLEAQSNCNIHGSTGAVKVNIDIKK